MMSDDRQNAIKKEKEIEMRAHDRKPRAKRERAWGNDYWDAEKRPDWWIKSDTLYRSKGPLEWHQTPNGLMAEAYEGDYHIVQTSNNWFALHRSSQTRGMGWSRIGEGKTIEELKVIAETTAAEHRKGRRRIAPEMFDHET